MMSVTSTYLYYCGCGVNIKNNGSEFASSGIPLCVGTIDTAEQPIVYWAIDFMGLWYDRIGVVPLVGAYAIGRRQ